MLTGADRALASSCAPSESWDRATHVDTLAEPISTAALFDVHRQLQTERKPIAIQYDSEPAFGVPLVDRTGRLWGHVVLIGSETNIAAEGIDVYAELAASSLEAADRLTLARRDQDRLLLLGAATDDAMYDWNFDTHELWWGGGFSTLYGGAPDTADAARWKYEQIHRNDAERIRRSFDTARFTMTTRWSEEYRLRRADGSYIDVEDRAYFLRDASGRAYRTVGTIRNITAMKTLLLREQDARTHAESASRAKDEFLAMLGHELRNPLAPIVTGLELIRMRGSIEVERDLPVLQRHTHHLIHLVDDLLDISRIAHGKIELSKERFEIAAVIGSAVESARPLLAARKHELAIDVPATGLEVDGDRSRLAQVLANLLTNAAKYTDPHGRISVIARRVDDHIEIRVRDSGIGIAAEMLPQVFTMFIQERQSLERSQGGLGLGLAIVRSLVELHGGTVEAHSGGRGQGSELIVRLPSTATAEPVSTRVTPSHQTVPVEGRKIMIVDDNEDAAEMLCFLLEEMGNTTRIAHDAHGALAIVEEFKPDLAVLDIGLPVMDGYELARRLRDMPSVKAVRLIALTGYGQPSDKQRAASAGFDAHLVKPVAVDQLKQLITRLTS